MNIKDLEKMVLDHEKRIEGLETQKRTSEKNSAGGFKKLSLKEFIQSKKPKNDVQKTLCIGYFLENHENLTTFHAPDLEKGFRLAKEPVPRNINDKVNKNIQKGYMMEDKEKKENKKAWVLTSSGEKYVNSDLSDK